MSDRPPASAAAPSGWWPVAAQPRAWGWLWVGWFAVLFYLSSLPGDFIDFHLFDWFDKIEHAGYFLIGGSVLGGWLVARGTWPRRWWVLPLVAALVGAFDEWHQKFSPGRSGLDPFDWMADVIGGSLALIPVRWWASRQARRNHVPQQRAAAD